jgi:transcriptional regulator with XRE-family HTH domain
MICYSQVMTGQDMKAARMASSWTQNDAAEKLGVTQAYLSMVERGTRPVSAELASKAVRILKLSVTALPLAPYRHHDRNGAFFQQALGSLGYPGFAYLRRTVRINPTELLMAALDSEDLDARVTEALPWLAVAFPRMDWAWLTFNAKVQDRQNRLAFITLLAAQIARRKGEPALEDLLLKMLETLERSRLAAEDTLCNQAMTAAERKWLRTHRSSEASHWNLLTDLRVEKLDHALR